MLIGSSPADKVVPVECGPIPGHALPQGVVGHVAHQREQVLAPHHALVLAGLQEPGGHTWEIIHSGVCVCVFLIFSYFNTPVFVRIFHISTTSQLRYF